MRLLITGGNGPLARALIHALSDEATFRTADVRFTEPLPEGVEAREGDLRDPAFAAEAVTGADAVLHLAPLAPPEGDDLTRLDHATRGTYELMRAVQSAGIEPMAVGSTLRLFDRLPLNWKLNTGWKPRPTPRIEHLGPWMAELSVRECARAMPVQATALRFGDMREESGEDVSAGIRRTMRLEDAVSAVRKALGFDAKERRRERNWRIVHVTDEGTAGTSSAADDAGEGGRSSSWRERLAPPEPIPFRSIRKVVLFGAGGPLGAVTAKELASSYTLRLTDLRPLEEIEREGNPQSPGAPLPEPLGAPHELRTVDVTDPDAVMAACEGMDAILNCTVLREHPVEAHRVNTLGAYNIARAAVHHRIRRVVQTGPQQVTVGGSIGYESDYDVASDAPPRPGVNLYAHTKYLGQEILRVFAEYHDLEAPTLLFTMFVNPEESDPRYLHPFTISWEDAARALRRALEVPILPSPYEVLNLLTDLPHGGFDNRKAKEILGWEPRDGLERFWMTEDRS